MADRRRRRRDPRRGLVTDRLRRQTGLGQWIPEETIGASLGDALLAAIGSGRARSDTRWARFATVLEPRTTTKDLYDRLFDLYKRLYPATLDAAHAALQEGLDTPP